MRRTIIFVMAVTIIGISAPASALSDYPVYIEKYRREYQLPANQEHFKILYGYHPYHFSNAARSRHSYSAFEKGHYQYETPDKPWPFPRHKYRFQKRFSDPARVLTSRQLSKQQQALNAYIESRMQAAKKKAAQPMVNDSQHLDDIIRQHKWEYQSKPMRDAILRDPDNVRADPKDYQTLFQDN
ncbi:MAG: hypothetical protein K8I00_00765 [Candidatus Omnitrophica bacterium]|nr:hypothetical protein [Candidatus Omnitrophota bacterium]